MLLDHFTSFLLPHHSRLGALQSTLTPEGLAMTDSNVRFARARRSVEACGVSAVHCIPVDSNRPIDRLETADLPCSQEATSRYRSLAQSLNFCFVKAEGQILLWHRRSSVAGSCGFMSSLLGFWDLWSRTVVGAWSGSKSRTFGKNTDVEIESGGT